MAGEELDDLLAIVDALDHAAPAPRRDGDGVGGAGELVPLADAGDGEAAELLELNRVVLAAPAGKRFEQRSDESIAWARRGKEVKKHQRELQAERAAKDKAVQALQLVAAQYPVVGKMFGIVRRRLQDQQAQCIVHVKLSTCPKIHGIAFQSYAKSQKRSARLVTSCLQAHQRTCLDNVLFRDLDRYSSASLTLRRHQVQRVGFSAVQWDETSQRLVGPRARQAPTNTKDSKGQVGVQVMMVSGAFGLKVIERDELGGVSQRSEHHPWHAHGLRFEAQDSDHLLGGLLRSLPVKLLDDGELAKLTGDHDVFLISLSCDRASANFVISKWLMDCLTQKHPLDVAEFEAAGPMTFTHYNYIEEGPTQHFEGGVVGDIVAATPKESADLFIEPLLNLLTVRSWKSATASRWTNVFSVIRRFAIGLLCKKVLPQAVIEVKIAASLTDGLETQLQDMIRADANDCSTRSNLRLLRMAKVFAGASMHQELLMMFVSMAPLERLQYLLLGSGDKVKRATLGDIVHPLRSPLIVAGSELLLLAQHFSADEACIWHILALSGSDMSSQSAKKSARKHVLQMAAGVQEVFELRLSQAPYSLCWMCYDDGDINPETNRNIAMDFMAAPVECMSDFTQKLRTLFTNPHEFLERAPLLLRTLMDDTFTGIDFSERSHSQMRRDLASAGPAQSFLAAADRVFVRQCVADHMAKGGCDPATTSVMALTEGDEDNHTIGEPAKKRRGVGMDPFLEFHNMRLAALKGIIAPKRALTSAEREHCQSKIRTEWENMSGEQQSKWKDLFNAKSSRLSKRPIVRAASQEAVVAVAQPSSAGFSGIWGISDNPKHLIPAASLREFLDSNASPVSKKAMSAVSEQLWVKREVEARCGVVREIAGPNIFCCQSYAKNVCRRHGVGRARAQSLDLLLRRINAWVAHLSKAARESAAELISFEGKQADEDDYTLSVISLLVYAKGRPVLQMTADCAIVARDGGQPMRSFLLPDLPFMCAIMERPSRPGPGFE